MRSSRSVKNVHPFVSKKRVKRLRSAVDYQLEQLEHRRLLSGGDIPAVPTPAGYWPFDDGAGTIATDASLHGFNATLGANATWVNGNVGSRAMRITGSSTGLATVTGPVVDTSASFTVSAWVNLSNLNGYQTVVSIAGTNVAGFYLGLRQDTGTFAFARIASDANAGASVAAASSAPVTGRWYHIVGVDDVAAGSLSLYVDGQLASTAAYVGGWKANGDTLIGHGIYGGNHVDFVNGSIDEVAMFSSALSAAQIAALDYPAAYTFEEGTGTTTADVSGHGNTLTLNANSSWSTGHNGDYSLALNGTNTANATNAAAVVNTAMPYSVSAWVKLNSLSGFQTFVSIDGANTSGFYLQLRGDTGRFSFARLASDANNAAVTRADAAAAPSIGTWYHLLGVNDPANGRIQLYVNGTLQATTNAPAPWQATGATVIGGGKYAGGRVDFVNGQIDDVRFFNSPLSPSAASFAPLIGSGIQSIVNVATGSTGVTISPDLFGAFMEDINYGGDGGIFNDEVRNAGFNDSTNALNAWTALTSGGAIAALTSDAATGPTAALTKSGKLTVTSGVSASARAAIANSGYFGVAVAPSTSYAVEFYAKASSGFTGPLTVSIESNTGTVYATAVIPSITTAWTKYTATLTTNAGVPISSTNRFVISTNSASANGQSIWFGSAHLFPPSYSGAPNHLRADLMEKLAAMKPAIFRVPGGNYLQGNTYADRFQWSKTIGRLEDRPGHLNSAWGYWSTDGMGLDEYLQMAEEVGARPIIGVYAGYTLGGTSDTGSVLTADVADAINELHYILDPVTTTWGALRAANGHPAPYDVREVEIGNEDFFSSTYPTRYPLFYDAIRAEFPSLKIIATHTATGGRPYDILDEHYYNSAQWFQSNQNFYDGRSRSGAKIFVGEYAAREGQPTNTMSAGLGDATWLLGLQENSDLVTMSSYAPLWANVNGIQWTPDLIGFNTTSSFGSPSYYAQVMLANHHGATVVSNSLTGGGSLRTMVSKTGDTFYLTVINLGGVANTTSVNLSGVSYVSPAAEMTSMTASSGSAMNSIANPTAIAPVSSIVTGLDTSFVRTFPAYSLSIMKFTASSAPLAVSQVSSGTLNFNAPVQQIAYAFSSDLAAGSVDPGDLLLQNLSTSEVIPSSSLIAVASGSSASFSFQNLPGGVLADGNYRATLNGSGVFDSTFNAIDGNNDAVAGGNHVFEFFFLNGDANRDRKVDTRDFNLLAGNFGGSGKNFSQGNFNYDSTGTVDSQDFNLFAAHYGVSLPAVASIPVLGAARMPTQSVFGERALEGGDVWKDLL